MSFPVKLSSSESQPTYCVPELQRVPLVDPVESNRSSSSSRRFDLRPWEIEGGDHLRAPRLATSHGP